MLSSRLVSSRPVSSRCTAPRVNPASRRLAPASGGVSIHGSSHDRRALAAARSQPQLAATDGTVVPSELEAARDLPITRLSAGISSHDDPPRTGLLHATLPIVIRLEIVPKLGTSVALNRSGRDTISVVITRDFATVVFVFAPRGRTIEH